MSELGESPVWLPKPGRLAWVDITRAQILTVDPASGAVSSTEAGQMVGSIGPTSQADVLLAALADGFALVDLGTGVVRTIAGVEEGIPANRMNDGKCDSRGRFWAGTMAFDEAPGAGTLYRLDPDGRVTPMLRDVTVSNGLDWSPDDRSMYYVDSATHRVDVFDFDSTDGAIANRRTLIDLGATGGTPDGLTVDADGWLWVAMWGGWSVRRFSPAGLPGVVIELPVSQVTSCAFGGEDLGELFITTAAIGLSKVEREGQAAAGSVFRCRPGAIGRPASRYRVS